MNTITPCLCFDGVAEEAARFYASVIPTAESTRFHPAPATFYPSDAAATSSRSSSR